MIIRLKKISTLALASIAIFMTAKAESALVHGTYEGSSGYGWSKCQLKLTQFNFGFFTTWTRVIYAGHKYDFGGDRIHTKKIELTSQRYTVTKHLTMTEFAYNREYSPTGDQVASDEFTVEMKLDAGGLVSEYKLFISNTRGKRYSEVRCRNLKKVGPEDFRP